LAALAVLLMFAAWPRVAAAQAPIRLLVIANTAQLLPEAFDNFEQTYGAGLIDLDIASTEVEPERLRNADVILA
jgi:hypothetical protein